MGVAEITTVSPGIIWTSLCSPFAIRTRAEVGSPWLPVVISTTFSGGRPRTWRRFTTMPDGTER